MASRANVLVSLAVERARSRLPGLAPHSVEVVELSRGQAFIVVRGRPSGIVVLDRSGRLVRGRDRLTAVGRHVRLLSLLDAALAEARLGQRLEHAQRSIAYLQQAVARNRSTKLAETVGALLASLQELERAIEETTVRTDPATDPRPTERTVRRAVSALNAAATADRAVVLQTRRLAGLLAVSRSPESGRTGGAERLHRWIVARLAGADLPYFRPEFAEDETAGYVKAFVSAARGEVVGASQ